MIITDQFIFIHDPKTGGSFVTSVLFELYEIKWNYWDQLRTTIFGASTYRTPYGQLTQNSKKHFGCLHIPKEYKNRLVLATMRNPYDWYTSQYEFGWWKKKSLIHLFKKVDYFERDFPHFPDISFAEFIHLSHLAFDTNFECAPELWQKAGWRTRLFLHNFATHPNQTLINHVQHETIPLQTLQADLYQPIHFIHTHSLNKELFQFLLSIGFPENKLQFILKKQKVLPLGKKREINKSWESYYTPELKKFVREKDSMIFKYFPAFDV